MPGLFDYNLAMASAFKRYGIWIILILSLVIAGVGIWFVNELINNVWVVPMDSNEFDSIRRSVMNGTADATVIMQAADRGMLAIFLGCMIAIGTGLSLPVVFFVNRRLELTRRAPMPSFAAHLRQAFWVGLWLACCMWLQMSRTFGLPVALLLAAVFVLVEVFIRVRSRAITLADAA